MADVVIRGMEIPGHCYRCPLRDKGDDHCVLQPESVETDSWEFQMEHCPILSIPEGHGRLVDAREVLEKADKAPWFDGDVSELGLLLGSEVTTIIPAEGGNADGNS